MEWVKIGFQLALGSLAVGCLVIVGMCFGAVLAAIAAVWREHRRTKAHAREQLKRMKPVEFTTPRRS